MINSIIHFLAGRSIPKEIDPPDLTDKQRTTLIIVAICTCFIACLPAAVVYFVFKVNALKNCSPEVQATASKIQSLTAKKAPENSEPTLPLEVIDELHTTLKALQFELSIMKDDEVREKISKLLDEFSNPQLLSGPLPQDENEKKRVLILREQFQMAVKQAALQRELRKKGKLVSPQEFEVPCLSRLGYRIDASKYHEKEFLFEVISHVSREELKKIEVKSFSEVETFFAKIALNVRLKQVGLTEPLKIEKFKLMLSFYKEIFQSINLTDYPLEIPETILKGKFPVTLEVLNQEFQDLKREALLASLAKYNTFFKDSFQDDSQLETVLQEGLEQKMAEHQEYVRTLWGEMKTGDFRLFPENTRKRFELKFSSIEKRIDFMQTHGSFLEYEMVQGALDPDEVFHDGLCLALVEELLLHALTAPEKTAGEIQPRINRHTRYNQVLHRLGHHKPKGLKYRELKPISTDDIRRQLTEEASSLEVSQGWALTLLGFADLPSNKGAAHAIALRFDPKNNIYELFDSNIGHFTFKNLPNGEELWTQCIQNLMKTLYPNLIDIKMSQMLLDVADAIPD